jgi:hypothetical protein
MRRQSSTPSKSLEFGGKPAQSNGFESPLDSNIGTSDSALDQTPLVVFFSTAGGRIQTATRHGLLYRFWRQSPAMPSTGKARKTPPKSERRRIITVLLPDPSPSANPPERDKQRDALQELFSTERDYVADLTLVLEVLSNQASEI